MVYKIFRKNLLFQDDFLIDCGRPKSRQDRSEQPRYCLGPQMDDTLVCVDGEGILHVGGAGMRTQAEQRVEVGRWFSLEG